MKPNQSSSSKSRLIARVYDYLTLAFAAGAWTSYGPRGWLMDEPAVRLLFHSRVEVRSRLAQQPEVASLDCGCCLPAVPCCAC